MFLVNSRLGSFAAVLHLPKESRPYPEVTAAVLPSSLRMFLSYTLVFSTQPPVSVYGTGTTWFIPRGFSWILFPSPCSLKKSDSRCATPLCRDGFAFSHGNDAPTL